MAGPFTSTGADLKPELHTGLLQFRKKEPCQTRNALKSTAILWRMPTRALAARVQQSWWQGAATLPMCSAYALGGTNGPALIESCIL